MERGQPQLLALAQLLAQVSNALHSLEQSKKEAKVTAEASALCAPELPFSYLYTSGTFWSSRSLLESAPPVSAQHPALPSSIKC